jgi:hypothetical protein
VSILVRKDISNGLQISALFRYQLPLLAEQVKAFTDFEYEGGKKRSLLL